MNVKIFLLYCSSFTTVVLGKYDISLNGFEVLVKNSTDLNMDNIKIKRFGRNQPHVVVGEFTIYRDVGNEIEMKSEFYKRQGYEYRKTPFEMKGKFCDVTQNDKVFTPQINPYTDLPRDFAVS